MLYGAVTDGVLDLGVNSCLAVEVRVRMRALDWRHIKRARVLPLFIFLFGHAVLACVHHLGLLATQQILFRYRTLSVTLVRCNLRYYTITLPIRRGRASSFRPHILLGTLLDNFADCSDIIKVSINYVFSLVAGSLLAVLRI